MKRRPALEYGLEDHLPPGTALLVSLQQVASMVVGVVTPALLLGGILKFPAADTAYIVSMSLLASALGTFVQTSRFGFIGSGLLSVTGTSFAFLQPLINAGRAGGLALMLGLSLCTAPAALVLAPFLPRLRRVFNPLVSGVVVLLIGLSIIPEAMSGIAAPPAPGAPVWSGALIALAVIGVVLGAQAFGGRKLRLGAILVGVAAGYVLCALCGYLHAPGPGPLLAIPHPFKFGFAFDWSMAAPFAFIYIVSLLEALGDMTATAQLSGLETRGAAHAARLRGGVLTDGLTSMVAAVIGSFPSTTYAQNNGVIQITGVASRRIGWWMALELALLGVIPAVGRWVTAMPPAVLGGMALLLFGMVSVSGLRLILSRGLTHRDALVVAVSLGIGLGAPSQPQWLASLPGWVQALLQSGISAGGMTALFLNLVLPDDTAEGAVDEI